MKIVEPSANLVNQSRRERVRIANRGLFGDGGLIALLEAAAVRDASKNTGNVLRVVHQAKPEEQLVLLVKVDVHPSIERVAVFVQLWRISVVREERAHRAGCRQRIQIQ